MVIKNQNIKLFIVFLLLCTLICCERISDETDPTKIIIGKWITTEIGNWPNMETVEEAGEYIEYLSDSIKIEYTPDIGSMQKKYWIDTLLHECIYSQEEHKCILTMHLKYEFFDNNKKMRQDFFIPALYKTVIYKRTK
jgi:hypothetical protein